MRTILNNTDKKLFKESRMIGDYHLMTAYIKNMGNDVKIKELELKTDVEFIFEGKERKETAILRFKDTNEKGMLYSYEYEFAGRKFAKNYVKDEYRTIKVINQALSYTDLYKISETKIPLNPTLENIWEYGIQSRSDIFYTFFYLTDPALFKYSVSKIGNTDMKDKYDLMTEIFVESLKFDKEVTYELNNKLHNYLTSKTR